MQLAVQASSIVGGMVVPGLIGAYLDSRFGTRFGALVGIGLGVVLGTIQLLALARRGTVGNRGAAGDRAKKPADDEDSDRDAGA